MERMKASDFPPEVLKLFDGYVHGFLSRRDFVDKAGKYAVGGFSASAMLDALRPNYAWAQQVPKNDSRIVAEYLTYPSPQGSGTMKGYMARPAGSGKWPGIVVIHENRGLNPYIEDVARRLAVDGFVAFAPDGQSVELEISGPLGAPALRGAGICARGGDHSPGHQAGQLDGGQQRALETG